MYEKDGSIVFFRDKIKTLARLKQLAAHELLGHVGIKRLLGGTYYRALLRSLSKLARRDQKIGKLLAYVRSTYGDLYSPNSELMYEELGAHLAELYGRKPESFSDRVHQFMRNIRIMFRNALRNWGIDIAMDHLDLEEMFEKSREAVERNYRDEATHDRSSEAERRYSRRRKNYDSEGQLKFFDYDREDNQDYSETKEYNETLDDRTTEQFQNLHDHDEAEYGNMTDEEREFDYYYENEAEFPEDFYGKEGWKLIQNYQENGSVIYDILPRILEEDYEFVNDPFAEYTDEDIPAPVQALLNITDNGEFFADLDHELLGAIPNNAVDLLENLKDRIKETFHKSFANKVIRNCDKAIEMIRKGEFKEGVIKPISVEELERQDIKKMPKTGWEIKDEYDKANGIYRGVNADILGSHIRYSLSSEAKQIKQKAIDNGTFLKAPNGKDSNLNEDQWIEARTQKFKDSFGDWELVGNADNISKMPIQNVSISTPLGKGSLENQAQKFGEITNINDKVKATIPVSSIGKILKHKGFDIASIFNSLNNLFETSLIAFSEPEKIKAGHKQHNNIEQYHHYINKFTDGKGNTYYIRFTLHQEKSKKGYGKGKNFIHSTFISDVNVYNANNNKTGNTAMTPILTNTGRTALPVDYKLQNFFNSAKEFDRSKLDENGEPKAEYLKSASNSSIVQKGKLSSKQKYSLGSDGQRQTNPESDNLEDPSLVVHTIKILL